MRSLQPVGMRCRTRGWTVGALMLLCAAATIPAFAQSGGDTAPKVPPAAAANPVAPPPSDLEPGVNTSATQSSSTEPAAVPAPARPVQTPGKKAAVAPAAATAAPATGAPKSGAGGSGKAHDNIQLDTTQITGNRELPKVLYIVPWKRSDLGDLVGKPVNSLLDEVLAPVDRDVFKRQNRYYDALKPDAAKDAGGAAAGADVKH